MGDCPLPIFANGGYSWESRGTTSGYHFWRMGIFWISDRPKMGSSLGFFFYRVQLRTVLLLSDFPNSTGIIICKSICCSVWSHLIGTGILILYYTIDIYIDYSALYILHHSDNCFFHVLSKVYMAGQTPCGPHGENISNNEDHQTPSQKHQDTGILDLLSLDLYLSGGFLK